jgi:integrase
MVRQIGKLNHLAVSRATKRGYLSDGGGLYLQVTATGAKSWVFRYRDAGRLHELGLGAAHTFTLAEARKRATEQRKLRADGIDPIGHRHAERSKAKLDKAKAMTFRQCAEAYMDAHRKAWKNDKHAAQWPATLTTYAYPIFGNLSVQSIDVALVTKALEPIWRAKTETASRLRGRIEAVLNWAKARGYRHGDNPARWRGHLDKLLPARAKVQAVEHHAALPSAGIGPFITQLREQEGLSSLALQFLILTATRTSEVLNATWAEVDLDAAIWTIPPDRMKARREHRVPLSKPTLTLLRELRSHRVGDFIFPSAKPNRPLSNMAMLKLLERMGRADLTVHGFRSTFRDWAAERTNFPREVAEHALAHSLRDKVEAAYRRGDLFDKRRNLMDAWARHCSQLAPLGEVVQIRSAHPPRTGRDK